MVTDVKSYNNVSEQSNKTAAKCGDVKIAPWGSFMPVSSKTTRKIYKNSVCAEADNVIDGVVWDFLIICKQTVITVNTKDVSSIISNLYLSSFPRYCRVHFSYPEDISDLKTEICFTNLKKTCTKEYFTVPEHLNLTRHQIRKACTSGLVSPYRVSDMYANVFCYICNGNRYSDSSKCYIDTNGNRGFTGNIISLLVDGAYLADSFTRLTEINKKKVSLACSSQYNCRKVSLFPIPVCFFF